jgi:hypothetical protein
MPRIRTIKPDAFTSDSLSSVPRGARWTFAGLWTYFDDAGRGRADPRLIEAALYPVDDGVTVADVAGDLDALEGIGAVCRYIVAGKRYIHAPEWHHQRINRPTESKLPPCPTHEGSLRTHGGLTEDSPPEKEKEREQGKGSGTGNRERSADADFDRFWAAYPKRVGKIKARKAWESATTKTDPNVIVSAAADFTTWHEAEGTDPKYIPHPTTWLNGENWTDERPARKKPQSNVGAHLELVQKLAEAEGRPVPQIGPGR